MDCKRALAGDRRRHRGGADAPAREGHGGGRQARRPRHDRGPRRRDRRGAATASIVGIGCETEPVSKNDEFQAFGEKVLRAVHADGPGAVDELRGGAGRADRQARREHRDRRSRSGSRAARSPRTCTRRRTRSASLVQLDGGTEELAPPGRDAHLVRGAGVHGAGRRARPRSSTPSGRSTSTPTRCRRSRSRRVRRSWTACSPSASSRPRPGGVLLEQAWIHDAVEDGRQGARGGRRERHGVRAGLGRRLVSATARGARRSGPPGPLPRSAGRCSSSRARA